MASSQPKAGPLTENPASLRVFEDETPLHEGNPNDSDTSSITEESTSMGDGDSDAYVAEPSDESTPVPKKRKLERSRWYLAGEARHPYRQTRATSDSTSLDGSVNRSLADEVGTPTGTPISSTTSKSSVCNSCSPVLDRYSLTFKSMLRQGSELKRRKLSNLNPRKPDFQHYRDLVKQNEWLRNNIFDPLGNYLFCSTCVNAALGACEILRKRIFIIP